MARFFKLLIVAGCALFAVAAFLYVIPSDKYILLPDKARPLAPQVFVEGERADNDGGGIYYVAVEIDKASVLEKLFHGIREGSTLVPASAVRAPGESEAEHRQVELHAMAESQKIGAAVALRSLGYPVRVKVLGTIIAGVDPKGPANGKLEPGDAIIAVDGHGDEDPRRHPPRDPKAQAGRDGPGRSSPRREAEDGRDQDRARAEAPGAAHHRRLPPGRLENLAPRCRFASISGRSVGPRPGSRSPSTSSRSSDTTSTAATRSRRAGSFSSTAPSCPSEG